MPQEGNVPLDLAFVQIGAMLGEWSLSLPLHSIY
jgi:hypothetical protein